MHEGVAVLDPAVVAPAEQRPVGMEEGGADGDAALGETVPRLSATAAASIRSTSACPRG